METRDLQLRLSEENMTTPLRSTDDVLNTYYSNIANYTQPGEKISRTPCWPRYVD